MMKATPAFPWQILKTRRWPDLDLAPEDNLPYQRVISIDHYKGTGLACSLATANSWRKAFKLAGLVSIFSAFFSNVSWC